MEFWSGASDTAYQDFLYDNDFIDPARYDTETLYDSIIVLKPGEPSFKIRDARKEGSVDTDKTISYIGQEIMGGKTRHVIEWDDVTPLVFRDYGKECPDCGKDLTI